MHNSFTQRYLRSRNLLVRYEAIVPKYELIEDWNKETCASSSAPLLSDIVVFHNVTSL